MKLTTLTVASALLVLAGPARAEPTGETTRVRVHGETIDYGHLHISANLLGYQLAKAGDGPISTLQVVQQFGDRLAARLSLTTPAAGFLYAGEVPVRVEAVALGFTTVETKLEKETVGVGAEGDKQYSIQMPVLNKNHGGAAAGLMYRYDFSRVPMAKGEADTQSTHLTAVVGYEVINASGIRGETEKFGKFQQDRWLHGGVDLLIDVVRGYDEEPSEDQGRFGGRLWMESMFGTKACLTGRLDLTYFPGGTGIVALASIGGGLHLGGK